MSLGTLTAGYILNLKPTMVAEGSPSFASRPYSWVHFSFLLVWFGGVGPVRRGCIGSCPILDALLLQLDAMFTLAMFLSFWLTHAKYAASALSTALLTPSLAVEFFPIFAPYMFDALGFDWAATVLAAAFIVFGMMAIAILWFCGKRIRSKSTYCMGNSQKVS